MKRLVDDSRGVRKQALVFVLRHPALAVRLHWWVWMPRLEPGEGITLLEDVEVRFDRSRQWAARMCVAWALHCRGSYLAELGRTDDAIGVWDDVIRRFGDADDPALRWWVARSMIRRALTLHAKGRIEDAIAGLHELEQYVVDETASAALRELAASAVRAQGYFLDELGRTDEAIAANRRLLGRFGGYGEHAIRELVASALNHIGDMHLKMERLDEAMAAHKEVVRRFGRTARPALREEVAQAALDEGIVLWRLGRRGEDLAVFEDVLRRFGKFKEPGVRVTLVHALLFKGFALEGLDRADEALVVYEELERFASDADDLIQDDVVEARKRRQELIQDGSSSY